AFGDGNSLVLECESVQEQGCAVVGEAGSPTKSVSTFYANNATFTSSMDSRNAWRSTRRSATQSAALKRALRRAAHPSEYGGCSRRRAGRRGRAPTLLLGHNPT